MFLDDQYLAAASKPQSSPRGAGPRDIGAAGRDRTMHGMWATRSNHQDPSGVACGLGRFSVSVRCAQKFARAHGEPLAKQRIDAANAIPETE